MNFSGTPFIISTASTFTKHGWIPAGSHTISADRKNVALTGGGHTGQYYVNYLRLDFEP